MIAPMMATPAMAPIATPAIAPELIAALGGVEDSKASTDDAVVDGLVEVLETPAADAVEDGDGVGFREVLDSTPPHSPNPS